MVACTCIFMLTNKAFRHMETCIRKSCVMCIENWNAKKRQVKNLDTTTFRIVDIVQSFYGYTSN